MKGGDQKGDGGPENVFLVTGAPLPTCPWQVPKSMELVHRLARAPAWVGMSTWDMEQPLGTDEPSPCAVGHKASLLA